MKFGLKQRDIRTIQEVFRRFPQIKKVVMLGSRAMGNFKRGSDVDLAVMDNIKPEIVSKASYILNEETTLPYLFDLLHYKSISNKELKRHIDEEGVVFYERK